MESCAGSLGETVSKVGRLDVFSFFDPKFDGDDGDKCESIELTTCQRIMGNAIKVLSQYHSFCFNLLQDFLPAVVLDVNERQTSNQKYRYRKMQE